MQGAWDYAHLTSRTMSVRIALNQSYAKYRTPHLGSMACTRSTHLHCTQPGISQCHLSNSQPKAIAYRMSYCGSVACDQARCLHGSRACSWMARCLRPAYC